MDTCQVHRMHDMMNTRNCEQQEANQKSHIGGDTCSSILSFWGIPIFTDPVWQSFEI